MGIDQLDIVRQRLEPMPASFRNKKRPAIVGRQSLHVVPKKSRRTAAKIDRDVEDGAPQAHDDFLIGLWGNLEMHTADRSSRGRVGMIDLGDRLVPTPSREFVSGEQPRQKATVIAAPSTLDCEGVRKRGRADGEVAAHTSPRKAEMSRSHRTSPALPA